jgi:DNA-damage-inducible protein J
MGAKKVAVSFKANKEDKETAVQIYDDLGLSLSTALNIFLKKTVAEGGLPFSLKDPFYSPENMTELKRRAEDVEKGQIEQHDLIDHGK